MENKYIFVRKNKVKESYVECNNIFREMFLHKFEDITHKIFKINIKDEKFTVSYKVIPKKEGIYNLNLKCDLDSKQAAEVLAQVNIELRNGAHRKDYNIIIIEDGVSEYYCNKISPKIAVCERLLRELIFIVMIKALGNEWSKDTIPEDMLRVIKENAHGMSDTQILESGLYEMTLKQVEDYLFTPYSKYKITDILKNISDLENMSKLEIIKNIKKYKPISIWERYFIKDGIEIENFQKNLEKIRMYRNKVAHNKEFYRDDYIECKGILDKFNQEIIEAIENAVNITFSGTPCTGKWFVEYNNNIYYWENNKESFGESGLWGIYNLQPNNKKKLICISADGKRNEVINEPAINDIYILNSRIYYETKETSGGRQETHLIYSVNLDGKDKKEHGEGHILNIDEKEEYIIINNKESLYSFNINTMKRNFLCYCSVYSNRNGLLGIDKDVIYYEEKTDKKNMVSLCKINLDGTDKRVLKALEEDMYGVYKIPCFEIIDDKLYFTVGAYAGTAHMYQTGKLISMDKNGDNYKVIAENVGDFFNISKKDTKVYIRIANSIESNNSNIRIDIESNKITNDNTIIYMNGQSFVFEDKVYIYEKDNANPKVLLDKIDYNKIKELKKVVKDIDLYKCTYIQKLNNKIFYALEASRYTPEDDIGWRMSYCRIKTFIYCNNTNDEQTELLYEY